MAALPAASTAATTAAAFLGAVRVVHDDIEGGRQLQRDRPSEAARGARDQGNSFPHAPEHTGRRHTRDVTVSARVLDATPAEDARREFTVWLGRCSQRSQTWFRG